MAVIKSQHAASLIKDAIVLDLGDIEHQAKRVREHAETKARQIIDDAKHRATEMEAQLKREQDEARRAAEQRGYEEGHAKGLAEGHEQGLSVAREEVIASFQPQLEAIATSLTQSTRQFDTDRAKLGREAQQAVVDFALRLARKVVHRVVEVDPTVIIDQVTVALGHVLRPLDVEVRIHPDDRAIIDEAIPEIAAAFHELEHVEWIDDPSIERGGCVVTYGQGRIDATLATQLNRIVEQLIPADSGRS